MVNPDNPYTARYILNPIYWPLWIGFGFMRLCIFLPLPAISLLARIISPIGMLFMTERRRITRTNIRLCFPHYSKSEVRRLMRQNFYSGTMAIFETALSWWGDDQFFKQNSKIEGMEHVEAALKEDKGVLLLGAHYTTLEIGGRVSMQFFKQLTPTYKRARNKLFNAMMVSSRSRIHGEILTSNNLRELLKRLKKNDILWYAPDQDFGNRGTVFAPFMNVQTATLTTTARIAKSSGAVVLPWYCERLDNNKGYKVTIGAALKDFPSGNDVEDATTINQSIEQQVTRLPNQYFWGHRRFKSRPVGEPLVYYPRRNSVLKRYSLLLAALTLPILIYLISIAVKFKDKRLFWQRSGLASYPKDIDIWLHAASVGEVNAIVPLIEKLHKENPDLKLLLTTNTPTGYENAHSKISNIDITYLPIDLHLSVKHFIDNCKPKVALITETEIWPNLFEYAAWKGTQMIIVNGRLSKKSIEGSNWKQYILCRSIQFVHYIFARSELDQQRFIKMCAEEEQIKVLGNIKWNKTGSMTTSAKSFSKPYILAASTRDEEELLIAKAFLKANPSEKLLVIVPRHPKRIKAIIDDLSSLDIEMAVHSRNQAVTDETRLYIADTFGELPDYIAGSEFVIMGGSFKDFGGQNIIEVARLSKAVIFGPFMSNFESEATAFIEHNAALSITENDLENTIEKLIKNSELAQQLGQNGYDLVNQYKNIVDDYYEELKKLVKVLN